MVAAEWRQGGGRQLVGSEAVQTLPNTHTGVVVVVCVCVVRRATEAETTSHPHPHPPPPLCVGECGGGQCPRRLGAATLPTALI